jgi:uncharacterized iron-regulated protein
LRLLLAVLSVLAAIDASAATELAVTAEALAAAMQGQRVVVLGEVHDNAAQHALRAAALRLLIARGARPAIAFEQFDREHQADIDRARRERPMDVDHLIAQARGAPGWNFDLYKPFLALALEYDLPIVAANLSRQDAMKIATGGAATPEIPAALLRTQEEAIAKGHCNLLPDDALPGMARAQIARDRALADAIAPYAQRGVVLLTGNEHARKDVGVPHWLAPPSASIALVERGDETPVDAFDAYVVTEPAARPDPCDELRKRMQPSRRGISVVRPASRVSAPDPAFEDRAGRRSSRGS